MNIELLKSSALFRGMDNDDIEKALKVFDAKSAVYNKGDLLHQPYTPMDRFGLVVSGIVQACADDIDGNRTIMSEVVPGVSFGESLCFLEINDSPVYIYALENCEILWLSAVNLFNDCPDEFTLRIQKRFTATLAMRTLSMNNRIQVLSKIKIRDKLIEYFNQQSHAHGSLTFQLPINRDDLATYIGSDRSALSRELSKMKGDGIIDYYKNTIQLLNKDKK